MTFEEAKNLYLQALADLNKVKLIEEALGNNLVKEFNNTPNSMLALRCSFYLQGSEVEKKVQAGRIVKDLRLMMGGAAKFEIEHIYSCGWSTYGYSIEFKQGSKRYSLTLPNFGSAQNIRDVKYANYGRCSLCLLDEKRVYNEIAAGNDINELTESYSKYKREHGRK